jgi:hypothetical protein
VHIATTRKKNNGKHCAQMLQILQRISKRSAGTCPGKVPNGVSGSPLPHKSWASSTRVHSRQDAALSMDAAHSAEARTGTLHSEEEAFCQIRSEGRHWQTCHTQQRRPPTDGDAHAEGAHCSSG